jgi:hypothetical protein
MHAAPGLTPICFHYEPTVASPSALDIVTQSPILILTRNTNSRVDRRSSAIRDTFVTIHAPLLVILGLAVSFNYSLGFLGVLWEKGLNRFINGLTTMYPNLYLKCFWQTDIRPEVFVAMSFDPTYQHRFEQVIQPAVEAVSMGGTQLHARRVDLSKSGDSVLTEIADGVAHCAVFLADVSTVGIDKATGKPYRNGNVMYEVGLALACRNPEEVLILRDDQDQLLFDLSTIPHKRIDFTDTASARTEIASAIVDRLNEQKALRDARVEIAASSITDAELVIMKNLGHYPPGTFWNLDRQNIQGVAAISRLLDKRLLKAVASFDGKRAAYEWTQLGSVVVQRIQTIPEFKPDTPAEEADAADK